MSFSSNLNKIQNLSLIKRKIIFWVIIIIFGLILFALWGINVQRRIKNFSSEKALNDINFPDLKEKLDILPKVEDPIEDIKKDLDSIKELQEKTK